MPGDRVTVQNLLDMAEKTRLLTEKVSDATVENAQAMEKLASAVNGVKEQLTDKRDKRETFLFRVIGALIVVVCFLAGFNIYEAFEPGRGDRLSAPRAPVPAEYKPPPPPD